LDADGKTVAVGDFAGQAHQVMANLVTALQAAGALLTNVVKTTIFVASSQQADLGVVWDVVRAAFGDLDAPSTLLGVSVLGYDDQLVGQLRPSHHRPQHPGGANFGRVDSSDRRDTADVMGGVARRPGVNVPKLNGGPHFPE
jgi:hypothetical protein